MSILDVLIPTFCRPAALAVTLMGLVGQTYQDFRIVISDQSEHMESTKGPEVQAVLRVLRVHGHEVETNWHLPRKGMAEQRAFLLDRARGKYSIFLDDDLILEPSVFERMVLMMNQTQCGFVGSAVIGLSYIDDVRPQEQQIEFWENEIKPERVVAGSREWHRYRLHNAANLYHVQKQMGARTDSSRPYRVAWVGGCVLYDTRKLMESGGFDFWSKLPAEHCGEDVYAQQRVMARFGGCGIIPSGVYHQELPTTISDRRLNAPEYLSTVGI